MAAKKKELTTTAPETQTVDVAEAVAQIDEALASHDLQVDQPALQEQLTQAQTAEGDGTAKLVLDVASLTEKIKSAASGIRAHGPAVASSLDGPLSLLDEVIAELEA